MSEQERQASTRARVVRELLDTPAVQELIRARAGHPAGDMGGLEMLVRRDPELALGLVVAAVDRVNDTARTISEVSNLVASLPAPLVREVLSDAWARLDGEAFSRAWQSVRGLGASGVVERAAVTTWLSRRVEVAFTGLAAGEWPPSALLRSSVQVVLEAYDRALQRHPGLVAMAISDALEGTDEDVIAHAADSTLEQVADVLAARPYLLKSLGKFVLRLASGSVRARFNR